MPFGFKKINFRKAFRNPFTKKATITPPIKLSKSRSKSIRISNSFTGRSNSFTGRSNSSTRRKLSRHKKFFIRNGKTAAISNKRNTSTQLANINNLPLELSINNKIDASKQKNILIDNNVFLLNTPFYRKQLSTGTTFNIIQEYLTTNIYNHKFIYTILCDTKTATASKVYLYTIPKEIYKHKYDRYTIVKEIQTTSELRRQIRLYSTPNYQYINERINNEILHYQLLSELIKLNITPHIILYQGNFDVQRNHEYFKYIVTETISPELGKVYSLADFFDNRDKQTEIADNFNILLSIYLQILYTLYIFQHINFIHNDLHLNNILIIEKKLKKPNTYYYYSIDYNNNNIEFVIPNYGYEVRIFDFDLSSMRINGTIDTNYYIKKFIYTKKHKINQHAIEKYRNATQFMQNYDCIFITYVLCYELIKIYEENIVKEINDFMTILEFSFNLNMLSYKKPNITHYLYALTNYDNHELTNNGNLIFSLINYIVEYNDIFKKPKTEQIEKGLKSQFTFVINDEKINLFYDKNDKLITDFTYNIEMKKLQNRKKTEKKNRIIK